MPTRRSPNGNHGDQLFETAVEQFDAAAELIGLSDRMRLLLRYPKNEIIVSFPVEMDGPEPTFEQRPLEFKDSATLASTALAPWAAWA